MDVLLPLKPKFIPLIFNGSKKWEFRKVFFKKYRKDDLIFIYATQPIEKVVGYFKGSEILIDAPQNLWMQCAEHAGLSEDDFFEYFRDKMQGYAIRIDELTIFPHRVALNLLGLSQPPQLYSYIDIVLRTRILSYAYNPRKVKALLYFSQIIKKMLPDESPPE